MSTVLVNYNPTLVVNVINVTQGGNAVNAADSVPDSTSYNFNTVPGDSVALLQFNTTPAQIIPENAIIKSIEFWYLIVPQTTNNSQFQSKIGVYSFNNTFNSFYIEDDNFNVNLDGSTDGFQTLITHTINEDNSFSTTTQQADFIQQLAGNQAGLLMFFEFQTNTTTSPPEQVQLTRIQFNPTTSFNLPVLRVTYEVQPHKILITNNTKVKFKSPFPAHVKAKLF